MEYTRSESETSSPDTSRNEEQDPIVKLLNSKTDTLQTSVRDYFDNILPGRNLKQLATDYNRLEITFQSEVKISDEPGSPTYSIQVFFLKYIQKKYSKEKQLELASMLYCATKSWDQRSWLSKALVPKPKDGEVDSVRDLARNREMKAVKRRKNNADKKSTENESDSNARVA